MLLFANAKINIGLHIVSKRDDGYHQIESILYPVGLCDAVEALPARDGKFEFSTFGNAVPGCLHDNLCVKAWELLHKHHHIPPVKMALVKKIPIGSGLGGGSSDATYVLKLLNTLFDLQLSTTQLENYATMLGSDCPFFVCNTPRFITGRGEIMENINLSLKGYWVAIVKPDVHVSTAEAYALITPEIPSFSLRNLQSLPIDEWKHTVINDFENVIADKHPIIADIKSSLYNKGAIYAAMSGSGSAVYGIFKNEPEERMFEKKGFFYWKGMLR
ncbi:MAG: 4-(cytidine 5'-diphospho)-2-C-methyl-D-erythritol kinase [Bacteroidota bacterium]